MVLGESRIVKWCNSLTVIFYLAVVQQKTDPEEDPYYDLDAAALIFICVNTLIVV